MIFRP